MNSVTAAIVTNSYDATDGRIGKLLNVRPACLHCINQFAYLFHRPLRTCVAFRYCLRGTLKLEQADVADSGRNDDIGRIPGESTSRDSILKDVDGFGDREEQS